MDRREWTCLVTLLAILGVFAVHFFSFTVFDGHSTFANDSFSYIREARNVSPWFDTAPHNLQTVPEHKRSPGFSWVLALTGASHSLWAAHLLVSVAMLAAIGWCGWQAFRASGRLVGTIATVAFCLLPGALISSMGILSENLYLLWSLLTISYYRRVRQSPEESWSGYAVLAALLATAMLTRTVGVALAMAVFIAALFAYGGNRRTALRLAASVGLGILLWAAWYALNTDDGAPAQHVFLAPIFAGEGIEWVARYAALMSGNIVSMVHAWNHYLTLSLSGAWFGLTSYVLLALCVVATILRAIRLHVDALYLVCYIVVVLAWPYPDAMGRFLHPAVMLLLLQPLFLLGWATKRYQLAPRMAASLAIVAVVTVNGLLAHLHLAQLRAGVEAQEPGLAHYVEFYDLTDREEATRLSRVWQLTENLMRSSAGMVPSDATVATVKHEAYMLLTDRHATMFSTLVPWPQQLCNLVIRDVDFVFLSPLHSKYVTDPFELIDHLTPISEYVLNSSDESGDLAYLLKLDRVALTAALAETGFECRDFRLR